MHRQPERIGACNLSSKGTESRLSHALLAALAVQTLKELRTLAGYHDFVAGYFRKVTVLVTLHCPSGKLEQPRSRRIGFTLIWHELFKFLLDQRQHFIDRHLSVGAGQETQGQKSEWMDAKPSR